MRRDNKPVRMEGRIDWRFGSVVLALVSLFAIIVVAGQQYRLFQREKDHLERKIDWQQSNYRLPVLPEPGPKVTALWGISGPSRQLAVGTDYKPYPNTSIAFMQRQIARRDNLLRRVHASLPIAEDRKLAAREIRRVVTAHRVHQLHIQTSTANYEFYRTTHLHLQMTGRLDSLREALNDIDNLPRMKSWEEVSFQALGRGVGAVTIHLSEYSVIVYEKRSDERTRLASCETEASGVWLPWLKAELRSTQEQYIRVCRRQYLNPRLALLYRELHRPDKLRELLSDMSLLSELAKRRRLLDLPF